MKLDLNKMTVDELETKIGELKKEETKLKQSTKHPYIVGEKYLIRTVTMIYTGVLQDVYDNEIVISKVCWIPETERWMDSCAKGKFKEVEPYPKEAQVIIGRSAILDMFIVDWELPTEQK